MPILKPDFRIVNNKTVPLIERKASPRVIQLNYKTTVLFLLS